VEAISRRDRQLAATVATRSCHTVPARPPAPTAAAKDGGNEPSVILPVTGRPPFADRGDAHRRGLSRVNPNVNHFEQHYGMGHPYLTDHMWEVVEHLQVKCPVARSDAPRALGGSSKGMWVLTKHDDVLRVLQDWQTFSSDYRRHVEADVDTGMGDMPPMFIDPPRQREFRHLLNPFLSPAAIAAHEPKVRRIVTELIDDFIDDGQCDLISQFAKLEPPLVLYRAVFGVEDEAELQLTLSHLRKLMDVSDPAAPAAGMAGWQDWISHFVGLRREGPRRADIIDALVYGTVEGRSLTDEEISGVIRILVLGGFFTTNDAIGSTMLALIEHPDLQQQLRRQPSLIPTMLEEVLRMEPPVMSLFRVCTRDVEVGGQRLENGDAVLMHFGGANRDPEAFDDPADLRIARPKNRHLTFGAGAHRCVGSHLARLNLRVIFEEILSRMDQIEITSGEAPRRTPASMEWGLDYLPISFTPVRAS
jgi:cytochrome P450